MKDRLWLMFLLCAFSGFMAGYAVANRRCERQAQLQPIEVLACEEYPCAAGEPCPVQHYPSELKGQVGHP